MIDYRLGRDVLLLLEYFCGFSGKFPLSKNTLRYVNVSRKQKLILNVFVEAYCRCGFGYYFIFFLYLMQCDKLHVF